MSNTQQEDVKTSVSSSSLKVDPEEIRDAANEAEWGERVAVSLPELFGVSEPLAHLPMQIAIPKHSSPLVPSKIACDFDPGVLRRFLILHMNREHIQLVGPAGCGKDFFLEQVFARMNRPLLSFCCNPETSADELIGRLDFDGEKVRPVYGVLAYAAHHGIALKLEEIALLQRGVRTGTNAFFEHRDSIHLSNFGFDPDVAPWDLTEEAFVVRRHRNSYFFATDNTGGRVSSLDGYERESVDASSNTRVKTLYFNYLPKSQEVAVLRRVRDEQGAKMAAFMGEGANVQKVVDMVTDSMLDMMLEVANHCRSAHIHGEMYTGISLRQLASWVKYTVAYGNVLEAFNDTMYTSVEETDREVMWDAFATYFPGADKNNLPPEVLYDPASQLKDPSAVSSFGAGGQ